jgi:hypothetical protein
MRGAKSLPNLIPQIDFYGWKKRVDIAYNMEPWSTLKNSMAGSAILFTVAYCPMT